MNVDLSKANWFKSSRSGGSKECVEVAFLSEGLTGVRDSKNPAGPALVFSPREWDAFVDNASSGSLDLA